MGQRNVLGKGLSALISKDAIVRNGHSPVLSLSISQIKPNPYQPRIEIKPETLAELVNSIKEHGIIQPLIVTKAGHEIYKLIAGERRLRAAKLAGLQTIPAVVREANSRQMLELAIVENIQRADLNPIEEALAFKQLVDHHNLSFKQVAKKLGISTSSVKNKIRLLNLPEPVKRALLEKKISEGHAKALLGLASTQAILVILKKCIREKLSVRETETLVRRSNKGRRKSKRRIFSTKALNYEKQLKEIFGEKIRVFSNKKGGRIVFRFVNDRDLTNLCSKLIKPNN